MNGSLFHDTFTISWTIHAPAEKLFAALDDPTARNKWGPPSDDEAIALLENDFHVEGLDVRRCGQKSDLRFPVEARYYEISRPHRLSFTERVSTDDRPLSTSLITVAIADNGSMTELDITIQIASLVGWAMIDGTRTGWQIAASKLATHLETSTREIQ